MQGGVEFNEWTRFGMSARDGGERESGERERKRGKGKEGIEKREVEEVDVDVDICHVWLGRYLRLPLEKWVGTYYLR